ncbi:hypothetical protein SVAN01_11599 [Stagonosporopsis vannaccii]|nr:hypothetical protein SVAN01_11599 [Stagonosporopsis vannaccii]
MLIATSCVNAVTDLFLLSVPISLLWNLQKPLRIGIAVFALLASGMFIFAACVIRVSLTVVPNIFVLNIARWAVRECCIAIIAVNSASLRPMFRRSFWTSKKRTQQAQQKRNTFLLVSARHARQRIHKLRHANQILNSTSAGPSTIDVYVQRERGDEDFVFEDPDYHVATNMWPCGAPGVGRGDVDLEKANAVRTEVVSGESDSAIVADGGGDAGGGAGTGGTLSSQQTLR